MAAKRKLQVFVSSTYQDLREERQAAVEAILTAGHIPAGMELFAAGDQSQMNAIKRWIDESDVFLLILGGRYGSIDPSSGRSYIHLEYDYAVAKGKPFFAVVIDEKYRDKRVKTRGIDVIEIENAAKLQKFRNQVLTRLVKFWSDPRDIKLAILETMAEFSRREDLIGWIPGDQSVNTVFLAEEMARLTKENAELRERVASATPIQTFSGLLFDEFRLALSREIVSFENVSGQREEDFVATITRIAREENHSEPTLLDSLWALKDTLPGRFDVNHDEQNIMNLMRRLGFYGVVEDITSESYINFNAYTLTPDGQRFLLRLAVEETLAEARATAPPKPTGRNRS